MFFVPPGLQAQIHTLDVESMFLSLTVGLYISFASFLFVRRGGAMPLSSFFDGADDGDESDHSEVKQRRKRQTEKARIALAASRATRKAEREAESASASAQTPFSLTANSATPRAAQDLQKKFLTGRLHYTHAMSQGFENILQPDQKRPTIEVGQDAFTAFCVPLHKCSRHCSQVLRPAQTQQCNVSSTQ